jgi:hypothetical protein
MNSKKKFRIPTIIIVVFFMVYKMSFVVAFNNNYELINANRTGELDVINSNGEPFNGYLRNVTGQKVHTNFTKNTNSCASCHMTHTATGSKLNFRNSIYYTCTACHFELMTPYDILNGYPTENHQGYGLLGGRFYDEGFIAEALELSAFHLTNGDFDHVNAVKDFDPDVTDINDLPQGQWDKPFTCSSCHAPHGSYGERNFNINVNGRATRFGDIDEIKLVKDQENEGRYIPDGILIEQTLPWLYYDVESPYFSEYGVVIELNDEVLTEQFFINLIDGYVEPKDLTDGQVAALDNKQVTIRFSRAIVLDMETEKKYDDSGNLIREETIYYGGTVEFCTACHEGYIGKNEYDQTVVYHDVFGDGTGHVINDNLYNVNAEHGYILSDRSTVDEEIEEPTNEEVITEEIITEEFIFSFDPRLKLEYNRILKDEEGNTVSYAEARLVCLTCHFAHGTEPPLMVDEDFDRITPESEPEGKWYHLRFGQSEGVWEVCFTCHDGPNSVPEKTYDPLNGFTSIIDAPEDEIVSDEPVVDEEPVSVPENLDEDIATEPEEPVEEPVEEPTMPDANEEVQEDPVKPPEEQEPVKPPEDPEPDPDPDPPLDPGDD